MQKISAKHAAHSLGYHLIWTPKYRHQALDERIGVDLKRIISQTCAEYDWLLHEIEVMEDHVHVFVQASHEVAPVEIAKTLKGISAVYLFERFPKLKGRKFWGSGMWSRGTYYASVGSISEKVVQDYIRTQKERG